MTIAVGDTIPAVDVRIMRDGAPVVVSSTEILGSGHVVLFAVPGAFTPGCSKQHLPGFISKAAELTSAGVDSIVCLGVNDVFVMGAWAKDQGITDEVTLLADGNADFTRAIGLEFDGSKFGMGVRSQRYSMVVNDGVVEKLNVEEGGEFKVSAADYMLEQL